MISTTALMAQQPGDALAPTRIERRDLRPDDVAVRVTHCGVCFTDLHALDATDPGAFPVVPGHEFTGEVLEVGSEVTRVAVGDRVAVGNIVDSCGQCPRCLDDEQAWCTQFPTLTYGGVDRHDGQRTLGGYSGAYVVRDEFVYRLPDGLDPAAAAPLMCAGVTMWGPLRSEQVGPGSRVGVVGIGGLGHLGVRLARAMGAEVTAITSSIAKADDALRLGASRVVVSQDDDAMRAAAGSLDVVLDTIGFEHDLEPYVGLLADRGVLYPVGFLGTLSIASMALLIGHKRLSSAGGGGRGSTVRMLEFCAEHGITADVEVLSASRAHEAIERLRAGDVRYRFVLAMQEA
ncbi:NAD(P)-dependent alcohol dehydrogenase [Nocardioides acrostichi]|uniref:alcohol dehydrogenase (NADP(+)) n=1 Tax=Nocardioides acrostichi TaxID=2784339 RepID=A0A930V1K6_9ACTN|nr:NAD(P)-dependent alcohol dehydrogenase [Nocardioides acrostichi]MBF4163707.1 NAD(P)-dependent alcohol dehydrogenase [Nocardioides acrostichi]